jgi:hypothetical protein
LTRVTHVCSRPPCAGAPRDRVTAHAAGLRSAHRGTGRGVRRPGRGPPHRRSDPRCRRHGSPGRPLRSGLARTRLRPERPPRPGDGAFLGRAGLHPWPQWHEIELGFVLVRHAQGRGLATEAARAWPDVVSGELGLRRLTAVIHPDNAASRALVTPAGLPRPPRGRHPVPRPGPGPGPGPRAGSGRLTRPELGRQHRPISMRGGVSAADGPAGRSPGGPAARSRPPAAPARRPAVPSCSRRPGPR